MSSRPKSHGAIVIGETPKGGKGRGGDGNALRLGHSWCPSWAQEPQHLGELGMMQSKYERMYVKQYQLAHTFGTESVAMS
jgi:hypothetical protein